MAEAFNQDLSGVSAPRRSDSFGRGRASGDDGVANAINLVSTIFAGGVKLVDDARNRGLQGEIADSISSNLGQLRKLKEAGNQNINVHQELQVRLAAKAKELRQRGFTPDAINKAFRDEGFLPPKAQIAQDLAAIEKAQAQAQAKREEDMLDELHAQGRAWTNPLTGAVDREKTLEMGKQDALARARTAAAMTKLGLTVDKKGEIGETARVEYFEMRPQIQEDTFKTAVIGLRPMVNRLNDMLRTATEADVGAIKEQFRAVAELADVFRVEQVALVRGLTTPEREDHMKFVDSLIIDLTQGVMGMGDVKDLSTLKSIALTLDWVNTTAELNLIQAMPTLMALVRTSPEIAASVLKVAMTATGTRAAITERMKSELMRLTPAKPQMWDMLPRDHNPKPGSLAPLGTDETNYNPREQAERIQGVVNVIADMNQRNVRVLKAGDAYAFVKFQGPLFNAQDRLTRENKDVLTEQYTHPNFLPNLEASFTYFPERAGEVGAFAFDTVQGDMQNQVREMRNLGGFGRKGRDFEIKYNNVTKKFEVQDSESFKLGEGESSLGTPASGTFAQDGPLQKRLDNLNRDADFLLQTKKYKEQFKGTSDMDFIQDIQALLTPSTVIERRELPGSRPLEGGEGKDVLNVETAPNISLEALEPVMLDTIDAISPLFDALKVPLVITSTTKGTHSPGSKHFSGNAIDIRSRQLSHKNKHKMVKDIQAILGPKFFVDLEDGKGGPHIHIQHGLKEDK